MHTEDIVVVIGGFMGTNLAKEHVPNFTGNVAATSFVSGAAVAVFLFNSLAATFSRNCNMSGFGSSAELIGVAGGYIGTNLVEKSMPTFSATAAGISFITGAAVTAFLVGLLSGWKGDSSR